MDTTDPHKLMSEALVGAGTSVWAWDVEEDVLTGMNGSVALLGYQPGELESTQDGWNAVIHPDDWPLNHQAYLQHAAGHTASYESEYRARTKDGSWRWLAERGRIVETGRHDELVDAKGLYYAMWRQQIGERRAVPAAPRPVAAMQA